MRFIATVLAALGFSLCGATSAAFAPSLPLAYVRIVLPNGLTLIVNEDHSVPLVSVHVRYRVGSANELPGRTGIAHLFEHLMFEGTEHFHGDWHTTLKESGATSYNANTSQDATVYMQTVPTAALDRVLWLESERMGYVELTQARLDKQRGIVQNEGRQNDNQFYRRLEERKFATLFMSDHPYQHSVQGSMPDLEAASLDEVRQWFRRYYGPSNAILVLSGDIDAQSAREKVERYFGEIPAGEPAGGFSQWVPTRLHSTREVVYDSIPAARLERIWLAPAGGNRDCALLALAAAVLGEGRNSLLKTELVEREKLAANPVAVASDSFRLANIFNIGMDVQTGVAPASVGEALDRLIANFIVRGPSKRDLERAKASVTANVLMQLGDGAERATSLALGEHLAGRPDFLSQHLEWVEQATAVDVRKAAWRYLTMGWHQIEVVPRDTRLAARSSEDRSAGLPAIPEMQPAKIFPAVEDVKLPNGMRLIFAPRSTAAYVYISIHFNAGNAADRPDKLGVAAFALDMLKEGTRDRDPAAIGDEEARLGAELLAVNDFDTSTVSLAAQPGRLKRSIALMADIVQNASFPAAALERVRARRLAALAEAQAEPGGAASIVLRRVLFGPGHGYSTPRSGLPDQSTLRRITREDVLAFKCDWLRPDNATIIVGGNTALAEVRPLIEAAFRNWRAPAVPLATKNDAEVSRVAAPRLILIDRPGAPQSEIFAASLAPGSGAANELAIQAVSKVLGGEITSRLNLNLREDKHWSYGVSSYLLDAKGPRVLFINAPVQTDKTAESLVEIIRELREIHSVRPISAAERKGVVTSTVRSLPGAYERFGAVMDSLKAAVVFGRPLEYPNGLAERYASLTLEELQATTRELIQTEQMIWVVVGDRAAIEGPLKGLRVAPLEHWTTADQPVN